MKFLSLLGIATLFFTHLAMGQLTGNIAIFKQSETLTSTSLRADLEAFGDSATGVRLIKASAAVLLRYAIYDITNNRMAIITYNPSYPVFEAGRLLRRKYYWTELAITEDFPFERLPLPQAGTEQWLLSSGDEYFHEETLGTAGLDTDDNLGNETWGLLGWASQWSGKATPHTFSPGNIAAVPRSISLRGLRVSHEFRFRQSFWINKDTPQDPPVFTIPATYLTHTSLPTVGTMVLDVALTGRANTVDIVGVGTSTSKRTIENGFATVIKALTDQKFTARP
jgi:hypothetical protein